MEFNIANVKFHLELNISNFEFQKQRCFAKYFEKRAVWLNSLKIKGKQPFPPTLGNLNLAYKDLCISNCPQRMDKLMQGAPKVLQNLLFQISFEIPDLIFELVFFLNFELNVAEGFMGFDYGQIRYFRIDVIPIKIVALVIVKDITI